MADTKPATLAPNSSVQVWNFSDPTAVPDGMHVIDQDVITLDENPFSAQRVMVRLKDSVLLFHKTSHRLKTHTRIDPGLMAFVAIGPNAGGTIDGLLMQPELLITVAPGEEANMIVNDGYSSVTLLISPKQMQDHFTARKFSTKFQVPQRISLSKGDGTCVSKFFQLGRKIATAARNNPNIFNDNKATRIAGREQMLEKLLPVLTIENNRGHELLGQDQTMSNYSQIINVAEEYTLANIDDRIYVSDLCRVAGVSERTLQYAFQELMQTTPVAYLNRLKLHRARANLRSASVTKTSVSAIAMDWGFWHFGEFSQAYKRCFQELPPETLRKLPGDDVVKR
jgi:AraC family ethanolamine operon transcriptional activator